MSLRRGDTNLGQSEQAEQEGNPFPVEQWFSTGGNVAPPGNVSQGLETFLVVKLAMGASGIKLAREDAHISPCTGQSQQQETIQPKVSAGPS